MTSNTATSTHHFKSGLFSNLVHGLLGVGPQSHSFASHTTSSTYQSVRHTQYGRCTFRLLPRNVIQSRNIEIPCNFCTKLIAESLENALISQSGNYNPFSALSPLHSHFTFGALLSHSPGITSLTGTPVLWSLC